MADRRAASSVMARGPERCFLVVGARPRRQAANQASKRFKSYSSDEDSDTSAETVPSEEEDSDDSNAGGKKKSKAAKARAVRSQEDAGGYSACVLLCRHFSTCHQVGKRSFAAQVICPCYDSERRLLLASEGLAFCMLR